MQSNYFVRDIPQIPLMQLIALLWTQRSRILLSAVLSEN